jgi:hypothetical protein
MHVPMEVPVGDRRPAATRHPAPQRHSSARRESRPVARPADGDNVSAKLTRDELARQMCADDGVNWDALTEQGRESFRRRADDYWPAVDSGHTQEEFWQRNELTI